MNALNLVIVGVHWPPETFLQRKIIGLRDRGYKITVTTSVSRRNFRQVISGVRIIRLPHYDDPFFLRLLQFGLLLLQLAFKRDGFGKIRKIWKASANRPIKQRLHFLLHGLSLARLSPDVVHFEWPSAALAYQHMLEVWGCSITLSLRGRQINVDPFVPGNEWMAEALAKLFNRTSAVHCVSSAIASEAEALGLDRSKVRLIRPAVDPVIFCPPSAARAPDGFFHVVSTGSLIWRKGYEYALSAVRLLKDRGIHVKYCIVGEGPERQRILYTVRDLGLTDHVCLYGSCTPGQVRDILQLADAFLLSSLSEGISNAVLEAMACGVPVVSTDCGGMREAVMDGVEGFVVPVRDPHALAQALLKLWHNPELRLSMGYAARQRVLLDFCLDKQAASFLDFYQNVANSS